MSEVMFTDVEEGVEILFDSRRREDQRRKKVVERGEQAWKEFIGREHPGQFLEDKESTYETSGHPEGVRFDYGGWYIDYFESISDDLPWGGSKWVVRRRCSLCGRTKRQGIRKPEQLADAFNKLICTWTRKCRKQAENTQRV